MAERLHFVFETLNIGVSHRTRNRNVIQGSGQGVAGTVEAHQVAHPCQLVGGFQAVGSSGRKIDELPAPSSMHDPRGLRRQDGLEVDLVDEEGLHQLGLDHWSGDLDDWLVDEEDAPFPHGADASGETELPQTLQEVPVKTTEGIEVLQVPGQESEALQVIEHVGQAGEHEIGTVGRVLAEEEAEGSGGGLAALPVGLCHRQLVEVGEQSQG